MSPLPNSRRPSIAGRDTILIFVGALAVFTINPPSEFVGFQTRFALFAREMLANGPTLFPTTYNAPYPDYPATSTFLIYLPARLFGAVRPWTAILPTAVASALILVLTYRLAAGYSRRWGWLAALFLLMTVTFLEQSRTIAIDQFVSLLTLIAFIAAYSSVDQGGRWRLAVIPCVLLAGFALRGPIGLVIPAAAVGSCFLARRAWAKLVYVAAMAGILLIVCMGALLAAAHRAGGDSFVDRVIGAEMASRMGGNGRSPLFYWVRSLGDYAVSFPVALLVGAGMYRRLRRPGEPAERLLGALALSTFVILVGMSIPGTKGSRYILAIAPPIALTASFLLVDAPQSGLLKGTRRYLLGLLGAFPWVALLGAIAAVVVVRKETEAYWSFAIALGLLGLVVGLGAVLPSRCSTAASREMLTAALAAAALSVVFAGIVSPIYYHTERTTPFVRQVESFRQAHPGPLVFYRLGPDAEDIKYAANSERLIQPRFISEREDLRAYETTACFITHKKYFEALQRDGTVAVEPVAQGRLGHKDCVAFRLTRLTTNVGL